MTQARNRKARQDANMDRQGMKGRITRQGRAADVISQPAGHPQPTDGGASQPHTMLCPPVPQRGPSRSLTSHQSMAWANPSASCPGLPSCDPGALPRAELGWPGMLAWLLVRHVHRGTSQLSLGGPGQALPSLLPHSHPQASEWGSLLLSLHLGAVGTEPKPKVLRGHAFSLCQGHAEMPSCPLWPNPNSYPSPSAPGGTP